MGAPSELGERGRAIWDSYQADGLNAGHRALIHELARCADTLDRLDGLAMGRQETWASLVFDDMGQVHLSVDKLLDERRNHQLAYRTLLAEVRQTGIEAKAPAGGNKKDEEPEDMLTKRRREKEERERKLG